MTCDEPSTTATPVVSKHELQNLFAIDTRSLGIFRISVALVVLVDLYRRSFDLGSMYAQGGALPLQAVNDFYGSTWKWSLHLWHDNWTYQAFLFGIAGTAAFTLLLGYQTRIASITCWVLTVSLNTRTPLLTNGGDVLLCMGLFWGMFLPLGARFSIDARTPAKIPASHPVLNVASAGILLQIGFMYLFTGIWKLNSTWLHGDALAIALSDQAVTRPLGQWLATSPMLCWYLTHATLWLETLGALLLFLPAITHRIRPLVLIALVGLHVGIELTMNVLMFSYAALAMLTLLVPPATWDWLSRHQAFRWINRSPLQGKPATTQARNRWLISAGRILGCAVIAYVLLYNIFSLQYRGQRWPRQLAGFNQVGTWFHFGQRWTMFDRPENHLLRFAFYGRLPDGKTVDLLRNEVREPGKGFPGSPWSHTSQRWMLLYRELTAPANRCFCHDVAHYLARQWNRVHPKSQQVLDGELIAYFLPAPGSPDSARSVLLNYCDMRASGTVRFGQRQGPWILRHDNRRKSGAGHYEAGLEEGRWTYWDERGHLELQGRYTRGQKQGKWTSWDTEGEAHYGIFLDDQLIERLP